MTDLAKQVCKIMGKEFTFSDVGAPNMSANRRCPDISKITKLTGFKPGTPLASGLITTIGGTCLTFQGKTSYLRKNCLNYEVTLYLTEDRRHSSFVVKGLLDLEENGEILLKFKRLPILLHNRCEFSNGKFEFIRKGYPWCIELGIKSLSSNKIVRIGIDLQDWVNQFSYHSIKNCD